MVCRALYFCLGKEKRKERSARKGRDSPEVPPSQKRKEFSVNIEIERRTGQIKLELFITLQHSAFLPIIKFGRRELIN